MLSDYEELVEYELSDEERTAVRQAVDRLGDTPPSRRAHALGAGWGASHRRVNP